MLSANRKRKKILTVALARNAKNSIPTRNQTKKMDHSSATLADTESKKVIELVMGRDAQTKIMSGGPDKTGQWAVIVEYCGDKWFSVKLSIQEIHEWRKRFSR